MKRMSLLLVLMFTLNYAAWAQSTQSHGIGEQPWY
jgi:hypothetical protein